MKLRRQILYSAPSLLAPVPVVRMEIAVQPDEAAAGDEGSRATARRLDELLPAIPSRLDPDKSAVPLFPEDRVYLPDEMVARVALSLQREFGFEVGFAQGLPPLAEGTIEACYEYSDPVMGLLAGQLAIVLIDAAWSREGTASGSETGGRLAALHAKGMDALKKNSLGVLTRRIIWECERRDIPWSRIHATQGLVQLGHGHRQKRFHGSYTGDTPYIAVMLATSKQFACDFFRSHGIPVPRQVPVQNANAAVAAARRLGYPVVLKPDRMDKGVGVSINLNDERDVRTAFESARSHGVVLVEQQIPGHDHRITLIHGRMVAAGCNLAARVIGDGRSTVEALIEIANSDPRRGKQDYCILTTIVVDKEILRNLEEQNITLDSIPEKGTIIALRRWWCHASDHTAEDLTDMVHPDNKSMFERAARLIGLDIAGIDFITPDISRPWTEVGGGINEINPTPGLNTHVRAGAPDIISMVIDAFFSPDNDGRIPTAAIAGTAGAARGVAEILESAGHTVGLATTQGVEIDKTVITRDDSSGQAGAHMVLGDPLTGAAVLQYSAGRISSEGLGLDKAGVGAVMTMAAVGQTAAETQASTALEDSMGLIVKVARELVVLDAEDPSCVSLASHSRAKRVCWIASDPDLPLIADHINKGGVAVAVANRDGVATICLWDSKKSTALAPVAGPDDAGRETAHNDVVETMFAAAIAYGLSVPLPVIAEVLAKKTWVRRRPNPPH